MRGVLRSPGAPGARPGLKVKAQVSGLPCRQLYSGAGGGRWAPDQHGGARTGRASTHKASENPCALQSPDRV